MFTFSLSPLPHLTWPLPVDKNTNFTVESAKSTHPSLLIETQAVNVFNTTSICAASLWVPGFYLRISPGTPLGHYLNFSTITCPLHRISVCCYLSPACPPFTFTFMYVLIPVTPEYLVYANTFSLYLTCTYTIIVPLQIPEYNFLWILIF